MDRHSWLVAVQELSISAQLINGGTVLTRINNASTVITELYQVLNRLARIQPRTPTLLAGGLMADCVVFAVVSV